MNVPQNSSRSTGARRAWAQPRFLLGAATLTLAGATLVSFAAPSATSAKAPIAMPHESTSRGKSKPLSLNDLPRLVEQYGEATRLKSLGTGTGGRTTRVVGTGQTGFNLVETDLTPNSPSDERQPVVSPSGDFIAFMSNGADSDGDGKIDALNAEGKYHIWVMNSDGTDQRQATGLSPFLNGTTGDINRNQSHPSWSPDGNQIVYSDEDSANPLTISQLWIIEPLVDVDGGTAGTQVGPPQQLTYFAGKKESPAWSPSGLSIAFVTDYDALSGAALATRDIYTISPDGLTNSLTRVTGDATNDPVGDTTDDDHPAWGVINKSLLFFSSDRDKDGLLTGAAANGRRIWRIFPDGTGANPVTDPLQRPNGQVDDQDDFPAPSTRGSFGGSGGTGNTIAEQLAFQTNTYLDDSDQADGPQSRDLNVWSFPLSTSGFTPPSVQAEPRVFVSAFDSNKVLAFNVNTLRLSDTFAQLPVNASTINKPESLAINTGINSDGDNTSFVYVAERGKNQIDRFDESNGAPAPGTVLTNPNDPNYNAAADAYALTPALVPEVSGLDTDDNYIYASSGNSTTALYRFNRASGIPAGASTTDPKWSSGEDSAGAVTACESIAIDRSGQWIAVSVLSGNKVNLYNKATGGYISNYVPSGSGGLSVPTGIAWGPDINGDSFPDLYVDSAGTDQVKAYAGPDPASSAAAITTGAFIANVVSDTNGNVAGLNGPEGLKIVDLDGNGKFELYVSSFRFPGSGSNGLPGEGTQVNRYELDVASQTAIPWPATATAPNPAANSAAYLIFPQDNNGNFTATGAAGIAFDAAALALGSTVTPVIAPDEKANAATVLTNILSSPKNFSDSRLTAPQTVDRAADREPSYSRNTGTAQLLARIVFASGREYSPNTTSNGTTSRVNPSGGPQLKADGSENASVTHDIWFTSTQDTTPPALIPQGAGNLVTPVVAPNPNAPYFAPRTAEAGLKANKPAGTSPDQGGLRLAVVLRDIESGLNERNTAVTNTSVTSTTSVFASLYDADSKIFPGYGTDTSTKESGQNDETEIVQRAHERRPLPVSIAGQTQFALNVYDDGPVASGGHEQQASAVAGDGNFYCEGFLPTPAAAGDYYIDVTARDRRNNSLLYDRVWGISTRPFVHVNPDLFVSDYAGGQTFPNIIASAGDDRRFSNQPPVESYFLTNPGGQAISPDAGNSTPQSFQSVDIWRILCRGTISQDVLNAFRPTVTVQIDPNSADKTQLTRKVAVSRSSVIWAAPYAGTTFVGPGTIIDPTTQERLRNFIGDGGRLFLSGRDIAYGLTSNGSQTNSFLRDQLGADFAGDNYGYGNGDSRVIAGPGEFLDGGGEPSFDGSRSFGGDYPNLRFPYQNPYPASDGDWGDGAENLDPGLAFPLDHLNPSAPTNATLTTSYTHQGSVVGQRIEQTQSNGLKSRVVFFSFGFESINRRYRRKTPSDSRVAVDSRYRVANFILSYFKTGSASGTVINNATNKPINGFLLQIQGPGGIYLARTDVNGNYSLTGLPFGSYSVRPFLNGGKTDPPGFFGGTTTGFSINLRNPDAKLVNLRPIPTQPGAIIGKAVASNGTPNNTLDDFPIANIPVLVRSIDKLVTTDPAGYFVRLATTDAGGNFQVGQVPSGVPIQVIFNPNNFDATKGDNQDVPASANINFQGHNDNFGRRAVPDTKRPNEILVPPNDTYYLNDIANDTFADEKTPILVPVGPTISGVISVNGTGVAGAKVELLTLNDDGSTTPYTDSPVQTSAGSGATTGANGAYSFVDVRAKSQGAGGTKYVIRATITRDNATLVRSVIITLNQGQDLTQNIDFVLATLTGKVVQGNNVPAANATVVLNNQDGTTFTVNGTVGRTAKTNAQGMYTLNNVPVGGYTYDPTAKVFNFTSANGNKNYNVVASLGTLTGSSGSFAVSATATNVTVNTIQLTNQQLSGTVFVRYVTANGNYTVPFQGATVELLDKNANSLSPKRTTTTGADGTYGFAGVTAGQYRIRATAKGDTVLSGEFTATSGASQGPDVTLVLHVIFGGVVNTSNQGVSGATVTLSQNGTVIETLTSRSDGSFQFAAVAAGSGYVVKAVKGTSSGSKTVPTIVRGVPPQPVVVPITFTPVVTTKPTSFAKGQTYAVSFPYETSANAATRNIYDRTAGDATIRVSDAFNYEPMGVRAGRTTRFYSLSRFNPNTLAYEPVADDGLLVRGEGYLLRVNEVPDSDEVLRLATPADNAALKPLTATTVNGQRFLVNLVYNSSLAGNGLNGRNFIGFPFDPARYGSISWDTTSTGTTAAGTVSVQVQFGSQRLTIKDAVAAGLIYPTLTDGTNGAATTSISAYGGYFVTARKEGVKLLFQFPTASN